jgi:hypothetical protein
MKPLIYKPAVAPMFIQTCRLLFLALMIRLYLVLSACQPRNEQIEQTETAVSDIRASLYAPADAKLLAEKLYHGSNGSTDSTGNSFFSSSRGYTDNPYIN